MSAIEERVQANVLPFGVRPMGELDVSQLTEIERDAFPTLFPPTSFRRELRNGLAHYLVAWRRSEAEGDTAPEEGAAPGPSGRGNGTRPLLSRLLSNARSAWTRRYTTWEPGQDFLAGFVGTWYMADEAHIVSVGVRSEYRTRGIGELLLIAAMEHAMQMPARVATLEVRVSNSVAQRLYEKYGFSAQGIRKAYYTDNQEDALIMTTEPMQAASFRKPFEELVQVHEHRWSHSERLLS